LPKIESWPSVQPSIDKVLGRLDQLPAATAANNSTLGSPNGVEPGSLPISFSSAKSGPHDNTLTGTITGQCKTEVIHGRGRWLHPAALEWANSHWVGRVSHRRLREPIGNPPPAESGPAYCRWQDESASAP
jgi:hypothetical protein